MLFDRWLFIVILVLLSVDADDLEDLIDYTQSAKEPADQYGGLTDHFRNQTENSLLSRSPRACPRVAVIPGPEWRFGEWSFWSECSRTCGPQGVRQRRRQCAASNPNCQTHESQRCNQRPCALGWSEWCEWEACRATCGSGERQRIRFCEGGTLRCPGKDFQISRCNAEVPCHGFHDWSAWTRCSKSCGLGEQRRERQCFDERLCRGSRIETRRCNEGPCVRRVADWSAWSRCDRDCDGGLSTRRRVDEVETRRCNEQPCGLYRRCQWTTWTPWSACRVAQNYDCRRPSGIGERRRERFCVGRTRAENCKWSCNGEAEKRENCRLDPRNNPCNRP
ncbi:Thrombospondin type 1 domain protein [Aphelenchoides besseyi]|nr:Thrombospondin type 1 domain protein [Aphelenchoides besseyi]